MPVRILLADDHALLRAGIRSLLEKIGDFAVVAEASDGREAVDLARSSRPDVVLMDIGMSGLNGLEATARITQELAHTRVLILSMHASEEYVVQAFRAGASGYLLKDAGAGELETAIRTAARGEKHLSPAVSGRLVDYLRRTEDPKQQLTSRQREILQMVGEGKRSKEIAAALSISLKTVETHRAQLMQRLGVHDVAGLVRAGIRLGLLPPE